MINVVSLMENLPLKASQEVSGWDCSNTLCSWSLGVCKHTDGERRY